jgi:proline dehydrogenase
MTPSRSRERCMRAAIGFFGEQVRAAAEAERAVDGYLELARRLSEAPPTANVALDLSHVGQDVSAEFCLRQLERIVDALPAGRGLDVGAEDSGRIDASHKILVALARRGVPVQATLQANLRRSGDDWPRLVEGHVSLALALERDQRAHVMAS